MAWIPAAPLLIGTLASVNGDNTLIIVAFLLFLVFGTFNGILLFFWTIDGKEIVTYADGVISLERHLPRWIRTHSFEVGPKLRLRVVPRAPRMWFQSEPFDWLLFLGSWRRGSLQFAYKRAYRGFGVDLNQAEAEFLMSQLRAN
ncbi:hypothetical protein [Tropicimonas sp. S265A]|uniref:hypothetical protein n=1 Tax=Tropicimonas sp. S265A TaxID=3415134 RepID=UPI003C7B421F